MQPQAIDKTFTWQEIAAPRCASLAMTVKTTNCHASLRESRNDSSQATRVY